MHWLSRRIGAPRPLGYSRVCLLKLPAASSLALAFRLWRPPAVLKVPLPISDYAATGGRGGAATSVGFGVVSRSSISSNKRAIISCSTANPKDLS